MPGARLKNGKKVAQEKKKDGYVKALGVLAQDEA